MGKKASSYSGIGELGRLRTGVRSPCANICAFCSTRGSSLCEIESATFSATLLKVSIKRASFWPRSFCSRRLLVVARLSSNLLCEVIVGQIIPFVSGHHLPRFFLAAFAPCFPSAVRVCSGKWPIVLLFFAVAAAFLMFAFAAVCCFSVGMDKGFH